MTALLNNRYRIIKTLGRGGFGETYLTEDTHMPSQRRCVLKQLKPIVKQPKIPLWMKERFGREAAILEELGDNSDRIPRLYAYFSEGDKFYLVQEWIEGLTLDSYWEQFGNLHRDEVRQILLQLLPVLDYVHSRHIIHRDIKPENIILRSGDKAPFLIDFGAVKEAIATQVNHNSSSTYSASIGTPGYMSSEQAAGRPIYSSDLYSLGLTAIFLLTGKSPQELETDPRNGEIIWQEQAFKLDPELAAVIDRAIRFHPRDRFASAKEMFDALKKPVSVSQINHPTAVTLNVAPNRDTARFVDQDNPNTQAFAPQPKKPKKRSLLTNVALFLLIAMGVAAGTLGASFALLSNVLRSPSPQRAEVEVEPTRQPDLFPSPEKVAEVKKAKKEKDAARKARLEQINEDAKKSDRESESDLVEPEPNLDKPPKTVAVVEPEQATEIDIPILTTGTSESQLVSTLGKPNSERRGTIRPNTKVLSYYNVVPDRVNLSYQSDDTGKIRQTDVALAQSVSLDVMEQTIAKMLGGDVSADIKDKLRRVYERQSNFFFFETKDFKGKFQRDSRDRINISVWEPDF